MANPKKDKNLLCTIFSEALNNTGKDVRRYRDYIAASFATVLVIFLFDLACSNLSTSEDRLARFIAGAITFAFVLFIFRVSESTWKHISPRRGVGVGLTFSAIFFLIVFGAKSYYERTVCVAENGADPEVTEPEPPPVDTPPPPSDTDPTPELIGDCNESAPTFPCWFLISDRSDSPQLVADLWYGDFDKTDLIAALHRDKEGRIDRFDQGDIVLVPPPDSTVDLAFYLDYLPIVGERRGFDDWIVVCDEKYSNKPCIHLLSVDLKMESILTMTYPAEQVSPIERPFVAANELSVTPDPGASLQVKLTLPDLFLEGNIVILPSLP